MGKPRILMLEDVTSDAELVKAELRDAGLEFTLLRVDTRTAFEQALDEFKPNIVLADYNLPTYNGREAVEHLRRTYPQIPVIMVTGAMGDESAVDLLKLGARDYVLKDRLARLAPAIKRVLSEEKGIRSRKLAEGKYRALFTEAMDGIVLINGVTWQIEDCNAEFERQAGRTLEQLKQLKVWEILLPEQQELAQQSLLEIRQAGSGRGNIFKMQKPDGGITPIEFSAKFLDIQQQSFIQSITHDITERQRLDEERQANEQRLQLAIQCGHMGVWELDLIDHTAYRSLEHDYIFGYESLLPQWTFELFLDHVLPEDRAEVNRIFKAAVANQTDWDFECRIRRIDGKVRWIWANGRHQRDSNGVMRRMIGIVQDITERKKTEANLLRLNRALNLLSKCNLVLVHAESEQELLSNICRLSVETGGYLMSWVGFAENDPAKTVRPVAQSGYEEGYLDNIKVTWADTELGQGPTGTAIRSRLTSVNQDCLTNPKMAPWREAAIKRGYQSSIGLPLVSKNHVLGALTIYSAEPFAFGKEEVTLLEELANDLAYGIETLRSRVENEQHATILRKSLEQSIQAIAATVEARDPYTAGHQRRVTDLATAIAREMGLPENQVSGLFVAASIYDLGKIHIPAEILVKPGKLSDIEFRLIKTHPQSGYDILKGIKFPWPIAEIVWQHHERLDGSGYPQGLKGDQILLESRILAVADVVEAMSSHRPYRPGLGIEAALEEIERNRGVQYDPKAVDACIKLFRELGYELPNY